MLGLRKRLGFGFARSGGLRALVATPRPDTEYAECSKVFTLDASTTTSGNRFQMTHIQFINFFYKD